MADIICEPNPFSPGFWTISAGTDRGRQWWAEANFPDIGWNLGASSFVFDEVKSALLEMPSGMTANFNGRQFLMTDQEAAHG